MNSKTIKKNNSKTKTKNKTTSKTKTKNKTKNKTNSKTNSKKLNISSKNKLSRHLHDDDFEIEDDEHTTHLPDLEDLNEAVDFNKYFENIDKRISKKQRDANKDRQGHVYQNEEIDLENYDEERTKQTEDDIYIEEFDKETHKINILEQYVKSIGKINILIIGMPCTDKTTISKLLYEDLNNNLRVKYVGDKHIGLINLKDYFLESNYKMIEIDKKDKHDDVANKTKLKIYETSENYDWDTLNEDANRNNGGSIIFGNYIDIEKIKFKIDFSFFLDMSVSQCKKIILEKKILPIKKDDSEIKLNTYFEYGFIPIYDNIKDSLKINKYFNIKESSVEESKKIYGELYDILVGLIQKIVMP